MTDRCAFSDRKGNRCARKAGHDPYIVPHTIVLAGGVLEIFRAPANAEAVSCP